MTANRLICLYPRRWRERYGVEFLALLEAMPITRRLVFDIVRAAGRERLERTPAGRVILAAAVAVTSTVCAAVLFRVLPMSTDFSPATPFWSGTFLYLSSGAPLIVGTLLMVAATTRRRHWYGRPELGVQLALLLISSVWAQWFAIGDQHGVAWDLGRIARASLGGTAYLTWMLILLLNVDRVAEPPVSLRARVPVRLRATRLGRSGEDGAAR